MLSRILLVLGAVTFVVAVVAAPAGAQYDPTPTSAPSTIVPTTPETTAAVAGVGETGGTALPETGSDGSLPLARVGAVLFATGVIALFAARQRRAGMVSLD